MAQNDSGSPMNTLEFLKIMSGDEPAREQGAPRVPAVPDPDDDLGETLAQLPTLDAAGEERPAEPVLMYIKGGPRRVVRADGRMPETSLALGQQKFALSSGHALFAPRRSSSLLRTSLLAVAALLVLVAIFVAVWFAAQGSVTQDKQRDAVGTTGFDGALSLTPADDGGYYTTFLVTSTATNEEQVGMLSQVILYRSDRATGAVTRVHVPANLYVAASGSSTEASTIQQMLEEAQQDNKQVRGITRVLSGIEKALNARLYNVVCCDESTFAELDGIMSGVVDPASFDTDGLLGRVRSNLTLDGIVEFCGKVGAADQGAIRDVTVPATSLDVNGTVMAHASSSAYLSALGWSALLPANAQYDEQGNILGTQYDAYGNPVFDDYGAPVGALHAEDGSLIFDENGYLQFYGQQYDEHGWPIGTRADEDGNPLLDWRGNPLGTVYDDEGNFVYDWRGNMVIEAV